jgi:hypothetical protein
MRGQQQQVLLLTTVSNFSVASANSSASHPSTFPTLFVKNSANLRLRKVEPHMPPVPGDASLMLSFGSSWVTSYEIRSTVPPPASHKTKLSPTFKSCGSRPLRVYMAAAS